MYETTFIAGWADIDLNGHMRNTAYLDRSVDVRMRFFAHCGFDLGEFARQRIGPVVMTDQLRYFREVALLEPFRGTLALAGLAPDGSRWRMRNEFHRADGELAARIDSVGGWLDLGARRLRAPPAVLGAALAALARTADFEALSSSLK